jgi:hypothetical protein
MKKITSFLYLAICLMVLSGCSTLSQLFLSQKLYTVNIDAYSHENIMPYRYTLSTTNDSISPYMKKEVEDYIEKMFLLHDIKRITEPENGIMHIVYDYNMKEKITAYDQTYPITSPISESTYTTESSMTTNTQHQITGYETRQRIAVSYVKTVQLTANIIKTNSEDEIWTMTMFHESNDKDIRKVIPFLLTGGNIHINTNTKGILRKTIGDRDSSYKKITGAKKIK